MRMAAGKNVPDLLCVKQTPKTHALRPKPYATLSRKPVEQLMHRCDLRDSLPSENLVNSAVCLTQPHMPVMVV